MTLPSETELEQSLMQVAAGVHAILPSDLDRHADLKVTFSEGEAVIEVEEKGNLRRHTMRVRKLQKKLNEAKAQLEDMKEKTQKNSPAPEPEPEESPPLKQSEERGSHPTESLHSDDLKDRLLG